MRNILIVDDDKNNRLAIKLNIHKHTDLKIYEAENGKEAVELSSTVVFDLIFMDIMMPVMNGIDATKEIKKISPNAMIIAVSAMDDDMHKGFMLQAGCEDYITKPFNPDVLKKRLANYLRLIVNRSAIHANTKPRNCFNDNVYDRCVMFSISQEASLALLWEEYLFSEKYSGFILLSDAIRTLYDISLALLDDGIPFVILCEENDQALYFSIKYAKSIEHRKDVLSIIQREFPHGESILFDDRFTIKIPCVSLTAPAVEACGFTTGEGGCENIACSPVLSVLEAVQDEEKPYRGVIRTEKHKISALEYISEHEEEFLDKCEEFEKLYEVLDQLIFEMDRTDNYHLLNEFGGNVMAFSQHVDTLFEFHQLSESIYGLGDILYRLDINGIDDHLKKLLVEFIGSFLSDLDSWIRNVFLEKTATDIHYLDSSLSSSFASIGSILSGNNDHEAESELELF